MSDHHFRRGSDDGFHVGYGQFVTHADYVAMTDALGYGDDRTDPAASPAQLLPMLLAAIEAQHEHIECERATEERDKAQPHPSPTHQPTEETPT